MACSLGSLSPGIALDNLDQAVNGFLTAFSLGEGSCFGEQLFSSLFIGFHCTGRLEWVSRVGSLRLVRIPREGIGRTRSLGRGRDGLGTDCPLPICIL